MRSRKYAASTPRPTVFAEGGQRAPSTTLGLRVSHPDQYPLLTGTALFSALVLFLTAVQFATPNLVGNDGYYHIKMAYLMRTEGWRLPFDWLALTVLNADRFVDHHFLFHVLLIPFTFGDLRLGAKMASVLFPAVAFLSFWWLLRRQRVPYAALWTAGLLVVSEAFIYRMSMPRAQSLSLAALIVAWHWLLTGRHRRLVPLAFFYVWLYNGFPLILLVAGAYGVARWLSDGQLEWRPLAYVGLGVALGLLIHPYFPNNLLFIYHHLGPKVLNPTASGVGSEWYPYKTTQLLENSGLALIAFLSGILALGLHDRRMDAPTATGLLLTLLFGFMLFKSRRFVEYFPAFALAFAALAWSPLIRRWEAQGHRWRHRISIGLMGAILLLTLPSNLQASRESLQRSKPYERYAEAAAWLQAHTPAGSRVFQTDWDDFPRLFFYNTHNTYIVGLDPTYMQRYDAELYDLWVEITQGRVERPSQAISERFGARYVFTDLAHRAFLEKAAEDPGLVEVYRDDDAVIFQVTAGSSASGSG